MFYLYMFCFEYIHYMSEWINECHTRRKGASLQLKKNVKDILENKSLLFVNMKESTHICTWKLIQIPTGIYCSGDKIRLLTISKN